jgi:hypothetical protein
VLTNHTAPICFPEFLVIIKIVTGHPPYWSGDFIKHEQTEQSGTTTMDTIYNILWILINNWATIVTKRQPNIKVPKNTRGSKNIQKLFQLLFIPIFFVTE